MTLRYTRKGRQDIHRVNRSHHYDPSGFTSIKTLGPKFHALLNEDTVLVLFHRERSSQIGEDLA
jgi:hypothetical protein